MFEELYALAVLYAHGFDTGKQYQDLLNEMTLQGREDMLELQYLPLKDAVIETLFLAEHGAKVDPDTFGRYLLQHLRETWKSKSTDFLGEHLYALCQTLPENLREQEPFQFFVYAEDEAAYCREKLLTESRCRRWFEDVFNYYENGKRLTIGISLTDQLRQ